MADDHGEKKMTENQNEQQQNPSIIDPIEQWLRKIDWNANEKQKREYAQLLSQNDITTLCQIGSMTIQEWDIVLHGRSIGHKAAIRDAAAKIGRPEQSDVVFVRRFDQKVFSKVKHISKETVAQFSVRMSNRFGVSKYVSWPLECSGFETFHAPDVNDLVICGKEYCISPFYYIAQFRNIGNMNQNYFRREIKKLVSEFGFGGIVSRQGREPFYDLTIWVPTTNDLNKFNIRLFGASNENNDNSNENNDNKYDGDGKGIASITKSYEDSISACQYYTSGPVERLTKFSIARNTEQPIDDGSRETGDDTEASSVTSENARLLLSHMYN